MSSAAAGDGAMVLPAAPPPVDRPLPYDSNDEARLESVSSASWNSSPPSELSLDMYLGTLVGAVVSAITRM